MNSVQILYGDTMLLSKTEPFPYRCCIFSMIQVTGSPEFPETNKKAEHSANGIFSERQGKAEPLIFLLGQSAMFFWNKDTVFLYRKRENPIYIYIPLCYYVFGEDWELSWIFPQKAGFFRQFSVIIYHFQLFLVFNQLSEAHRQKD